MRLTYDSDVHIGIVCEPHGLDSPTREDLLSSVGSVWTLDYMSEADPSMPIWEAYDKGTVGGIGVEVHWLAVAKLTDVLEQVVNHGAITTEAVPSRPYTMGSMVQRSWLLRDKRGVFKMWRDQTSVYPRRLKQNILKHNTPLLKDAVDELTRSAERRSGPGIILFFLGHGIHALDSIAFALNDMYDPSDRRAEKTVLPGLLNVPRDFMGRYNQVLEGPFDEEGAIERVREFEELAKEVLALAEPEIAGA